MAAKSTTTGRAAASPEAVKQITYLAGALKAPRITEAAARLADQARDAGWTHEDYLAAVLEREVSARNASGAQLRIRAAGFGTVKSLEDFDFDAQPSIRQQVGALGPGGFLTEGRNVVLLGPPGPPGTGKTHYADLRIMPTWSRNRCWESRPPAPGTGCCSPPPPTGSPGSPTPTAPEGCPKN